MQEEGREGRVVGRRERTPQRPPTVSNSTSSAFAHCHPVRTSMTSCPECDCTPFELKARSYSTELITME